MRQRRRCFPKRAGACCSLDNASKDPLAGVWDLSWHPRARHIREEELGLTPARLRGIRESQGELLVFVDDDNVLDDAYLATAVSLAGQWDILVRSEETSVRSLQTAPPAWAEKQFCNLAIREVKRARWSNDPESWTTQPCGAGLCVRACVASQYVDLVESTPWRRHLDRRGNSLMSLGDTDLVPGLGVVRQGLGLLPRVIADPPHPPSPLDGRLPRASRARHRGLNSRPSLFHQGDPDRLHRFPHRSNPHALLAAVVRPAQLKFRMAPYNSRAVARKIIAAIEQTPSVPSRCRLSLRERTSFRRAKGDLVRCSAGSPPGARKRLRATEHLCRRGPYDAGALAARHGLAVHPRPGASDARWPRNPAADSDRDALPQPGAFIEATIRSILLQGYPNLQYIVVDGGSSDNTRQVLDHYRSEISTVIVEPDEGQADAINKGLALADGKIFHWINSDDYLLPGALSAVADAWKDRSAC